MVDKLLLNRAIVCVIGLGYVGLPLAEAFSKSLNGLGGNLKLRQQRTLIKSPNLNAIILAVAHYVFQEMTVGKLKSIMNAEPALIDIRGLFNETEAEEKGFYYKGLSFGREELRWAQH